MEGSHHSAYSGVRAKLAISRHHTAYYPVDFSNLTQQYTRGKLEREDLNANPVTQFAGWFEEARQAGLDEPTAMMLATVSADGRPLQRTVLLKSFDGKGFVFYTNYESTKAKHISENPSVCLIFPWLKLERQVIIQGKAMRMSSTESFKYFASRPRGSQIGAWISPQSTVISNRALIEQKFEEMKRKFASGEIPLPSFWGGYRVIPEKIEFWQGRPNRLHDRFLYSKSSGNTWEINRLAP